HGPAVSFVIQEKKDNVPAKDASIDLLVMIRVSHHLPDPGPVINEINRVLRPGGEALIEIANEAHFVNRLRYLRRFKAVPKEAVPIGVHANGKEDRTPFVNHNPLTIEQAFAELGLRRIGKLSVSNFRHSLFKQHIPMKVLLLGERMLQRPFSLINFGPSIFILFKKPEN
ncbi:class I SAM-dependent methyltransferase, partial [Patescibacteria group bacterium]|nr:class I SAM-dependent methyltransferase [Patescibacteria group bacterium]